MNGEEQTEISEKDLKQELKKQALQDTKALESWIEEQLNDWEKYIYNHRYILGDINKIKQSFLKKISKRHNQQVL